MVANVIIVASSFIGLTASCLRYGEQIGSPTLAEAVIYFYYNAWKASTTRTYSTGQRHWQQFTTKFPGISLFPHPRAALQEFELALAFFAAHLALQPTITRSTTVAAYLSHVRTLWQHNGCPKSCLSSKFVALVTRGIHRALPATPDDRSAFLLLDCRPPPDFLNPTTTLLFRLKFATILGFFGMLRFNVFSKIKPASIILVTASGRRTILTRIPVSQARSICRYFIGFYFHFRGKSTPIGAPPQAAYFPRLIDINPSFTPFCPLHLISQMHVRGFFLRPARHLFPDSFTPKDLCPYLIHLAGGGRVSVELALIKSHSLRIGGHTYYTALGMSPDLTDFLGRRKVSRSSLRYFRASPSLTISAIRCFFLSVPPPHDPKVALQ